MADPTIPAEPMSDNDLAKSILKDAADFEERMHAKIDEMRQSMQQSNRELSALVRGITLPPAPL